MRDRPGETRECQTARECEYEQARNGFECDNEIRGQGVRTHVAVADCRERLYAEEEGVLHVLDGRRPDRPGQTARPAQYVERREACVQGEVNGDHDGEEP